MTAPEIPAGAELGRAEARVHGRYLWRPGPQGAPRRLLVGFHGYAETAGPHLEALLAIPGVETWTVAAVQALHPFYTRSGEVVANWMTRLDRELAIADNVAYVRSVVETLGERLGGVDALVFAGFSQGTAMAYRAAVLAGLPCDGIVALGGDVPGELTGGSEDLPPVVIGRGGGDEWYTDEKLAADLERLSAWGAEVEVCRFEGGHEWTPEFRRSAGRFLARIAAA